MFGDFFESYGLINIGFNGLKFTWECGNLKETIDIGLCNLNWKLKYQDASFVHLSLFKSNHKPNFLKMVTNSPSMLKIDAFFFFFFLVFDSMAHC